MKITKYAHSCLLLEDQGKIVLIDPGSFSEGVLPVEKLTQMDYLLITHEHFDHFSLPLVKQLVAKFPKIKIITTNTIKDLLANENISATTIGDEIVNVTPVPHESNVGYKSPQNIMVTVFGRLAHPGDSHTFSTNAEILALPVVAPWGTTARAVELAEELKPKIAIPIHDAIINDSERKEVYAFVGNELSAKGIDFKKIENGQPIEV